MRTFPKQKTARSVGRINFAVVAVTASLFLAIAAFVAFSTSRMMENEARSTVENVVKATVGRIDRQMASVESAVENSAWIVEEKLSDPDYMFRITGELVQNNPFIVGSTIAFEPNFFPSKGYYYSAFSCKDGNGGIKRIQQGGEAFRYHGMDWYRVPKESKKSSWCEPYFDSGGAEVMMCTYSVPLFARDGKVYAVLTADVSLDALTRHVAAIKPYPDSYAVLFSELGIARKIQSSVLKRKTPPYIGAILRPAREVAGDFYDFQEKDGLLYFAVGDASGKGIPAALFAFLASAGFHMATDMGLPPDEIVARINALLCRDNDACMFVTLFVGRLDLSTRRLEYCNAGHMPLVVLRPGGAAEFLAAEHNVVAGALDGYAHAAQETTFEPGTMLLAYTDGVTEAERADHEQYGEKRLLAFASAHSKDAPSDFVEGMERDLDAFTAGAEQSDDITALAILAGGVPADASPVETMSRGILKA